MVGGRGGGRGGVEGYVGTPKGGGSTLSRGSTAAAVAAAAAAVTAADGTGITGCTKPAPLWLPMLGPGPCSSVLVAAAPAAEELPAVRPGWVGRPGGGALCCCCVAAADERRLKKLVTGTAVWHER